MLKKSTASKWIIFFCSIFAGCATGPYSQPESEVIKKPDYAEVILYFKPISAWQKNTNIGAALIVVDNQEIGKLKFGEKARVLLQEGKRTFQIYINESYLLIPVIPKIGARWSQTLSLAKNGNYVYELSWGGGSTLLLGPNIQTGKLDYLTVVKMPEFVEQNLKTSFTYSE